MTKKRAVAATALFEYMEKGKWTLVTNDTQGLDAVLLFFDRIGYDHLEGEISTKVAHEYFDATLRYYYQASEDYITQAQSESPDSSTTFENVKPLFNAVAELEAEKTKRTMTELRFTT
jgi:hypothetical protein